MVRILVTGGLLISAVLIWFAVSTYRGAFPLAQENLKGLALSLSGAVENIVSHDPSLGSLASFNPSDLAFIAVVDEKGIFRFHSNPDLVGSRPEDEKYMTALRSGASFEGRVRLGTGETAYEYIAPVHLPNRTLVLALTLHTHRADGVIRRARYDLAAFLGLLGAGWFLSGIIYRFVRREEKHRQAMVRQASLAQLGQMGATLAHEIRNPLGGIKGFAQLIEQKPTDSRNAGFAARIVAETVRLESLVENLLGYSRSLGAAAPFLLHEVVTQQLALVQEEAREKGAVVDVSCPEGILLHGERDRVGQVLLNLVRNAMEAMPAGGTLAVRAERKAHTASVAISDTGEGMPDEAIDHLFEPFYTTKAKGTGLGLALCKKVVEEHGGTIELAHTGRAGTTFLVTLPLEERRQS